MTLQYRIRSKYEDQRWRLRVYLCDRFILETVDRWCQSDADFPMGSVVARVLYLFSPRCEPSEMSSHRVCDQLSEIVGTPESEYLLAWPKRDESQGKALIASLSAIVQAAVESWADRDVLDPSSGWLAQRLADEIVTSQYVVFHHCETTRRDVNHFGV